MTSPLAEFIAAPLATEPASNTLPAGVFLENCRNHRNPKFGAGGGGVGVRGILFSKSRWVGDRPRVGTERVDRTAEARPYAWRIGVRGTYLVDLELAVGRGGLGLGC